MDDKIKYFGRFGKGLPNANTLSFLEIDKYLSRCDFIIAQVKNPDTKKNHWIIIEEKKNGKYVIVDPGKNRTSLAIYNNKIYRFIVYKKVFGCNKLN